MGMLVLLPLFFFLSAIAPTSTSLQENNQNQHQINSLRPKSGVGNGRGGSLSCLSWRLGVETNNIIQWQTIPQECQGYVKYYMLGQQYRKDSKAIVDEALLYAKSLKPAADGRDIWVFDVDETSLSNLPFLAKHGFGVEPYNPREYSEWVNKGKAPALPESLKLYRKLLSLGIKVVFLTGRPEYQRHVTASNLKSVGFHAWEKLILRESYDIEKTALEYKSNKRRILERNGYRIVGNIGDQWSDLLGIHAGNRTFKLPDPVYYIS